MSLTCLLESPGRFQGPLKQKEVLLGHRFPVPFSSGFWGFFFVFVVQNVAVLNMSSGGKHACM